jgi:hypothetical protein
MVKLPVTHPRAGRQHFKPLAQASCAGQLEGWVHLAGSQMVAVRLGGDSLVSPSLLTTSTTPSDIAKKNDRHAMHLHRLE